MWAQQSCSILGGLQSHSGVSCGREKGHSNRTGEKSGLREKPQEIWVGGELWKTQKPQPKRGNRNSASQDSILQAKHYNMWLSQLAAFHERAWKEICCYRCMYVCWDLFSLFSLWLIKARVQALMNQSMHWDISSWRAPSHHHSSMNLNVVFLQKQIPPVTEKGIPGRTKAMVPDYMEHPCMELDVREWPAPPVKTSMGERWAEWKTEKENERWADPLTSPLDPPLSIQIPWETDSHAPGPHHKHMLISALQIGWHGKENTHTHTGCWSHGFLLPSQPLTPSMGSHSLPDGLQAWEISFMWRYDGIHFSSLASKECFSRFSYHANPCKDF